MQIFTSTENLKEFLKGKTEIGFVPTMGNLHRGHLSLIERSSQDNAATVVSIFVNPTQFSADEDFDAYPRTLQEDIDKISHLEKSNIIIYAPNSMNDVYGDDNKIYKVEGPTSILEGMVRPTHFDGVTTVVYHLFNIVKPKNAYFGLKDYQQLVLIKNLSDEYKLNINVVGMPIIREENGLALSSRNGLLTEKERTDALTLNKALHKIRELYQNEHDVDKVKEYIKELLTDKRFNYLELREKNTLSHVDRTTKGFVVLGNFQINNTKLLDNLEFN
jgi:pantoate--beta-alanine ligase